MAHFVVRAAGLIVTPILVYAFFFYLHFAILKNSGPGDSTMSSLFQANLAGNTFFNHPRDVVYGSVITFRNNAYGGGILHSHVQSYPAGSKQQQVTAYTHHDTNNHWLVTKTTRASHYPDLEYLQDGDIIILRHNSTQTNMHSHYVEAPLSKGDYEVSCYGNAEIGDDNDHWRVEVLNPSPDGRIKTLTTRLRLHHVTTSCILSSHPNILPEWGFKQYEVSCMKKDYKEENLVWNIESHFNDRRKPFPAPSCVTRPLSSPFPFSSSPPCFLSFQCPRILSPFQKPVSSPISCS